MRHPAWLLTLHRPDGIISFSLDRNTGEMLAFNVAQLLKEGIGASRHRLLSGDLYDVDDHNSGPLAVTGSVSFVRTPAGVLVTGQATATLELVCRRCLEPVLRGVTLQIEEEFVPSIDVVTGRPLVVDPEVSSELVMDERHTLDLTEVLWQYAVAETMQPVHCREDCLGLCPRCGANLNLGPCQCTNVETDPRLAKLGQLLGLPGQGEMTEEGKDL